MTPERIAELRARGMAEITELCDEVERLRDTLAHAAARYRHDAALFAAILDAP